MKRVRLIWHVLPWFAGIAIVPLLAASWLAVRSAHSFHLEETRSALHARLAMLRVLLDPSLPGDRMQLQSEAAALAAAGHARVTVIAPDGTVLADSDEASASMENHGGRPEFALALAGRPGDSLRYSTTVQRQMLYVAQPLEAGGRVQGAIRLAVPVRSLQATFGALSRRIAATGLVVALMAVAAAILASRHVTGPLVTLQRVVARFSRGDLAARAPLASAAEIAVLAEAMNRMAAELDQKIGAVTRQRNEQDAILAGMKEGVLALDGTRHILNANASAGQLLGFEAGRARGRALQEVVREPALEAFIDRVFGGGAAEADIELRARGNVVAQVRGGPIRGASGEPIGAVIVLNDITRLKQLEQVRCDFVANVSHELKTPVTSIRGFSEALLDELPGDQKEPRRFVEIIAAQSARLESIINDLLILSRLEHEGESVPALQVLPLEPVIRSAVAVCAPRAEARNITTTIDCPPDARAHMSPALIEQALVNLVENAVTYSEPGGTVEIAVRAAGGPVTLTVRDRGCGIAAEHLPRLFERFYRVDKSRSRKSGGTGLGLSIVRHIAILHGGSVSVESEPGRGSAFSIHLPQPL